jgi:PAS domain S-box-containing protein
MSKISHIKRVEARFMEERERVLRGLASLDDVNAMNPRPDPVLFGGDLAQLGAKGELELGAERESFVPLNCWSSQGAISLKTAVSCSDLLPEYADRERAEKGLRRSETLLAEGQRLSQTGSFAWNPSSGEIYWSDETYRIFEYERSATPAVELLRQRVHPEDVAFVREFVERALHDGREFTYEYRLLMPDGRVKHLHVVARGIRHDKGDVDIVGAVRDVTEQKWTQTERERLEQRLRQAEKMEAVGQRVGGIAHDFNNVLAGVLAYGEMLLEGTPGDSELKRYAQNVLAAATRGRELVDQILTYSRTQRGARVPVDLAKVVAETLELLRGSLPAGIRLEASAPEAPLVLISDATQLHQVTMNLCSNAIQAMSTGGTLRVTLEAVELPAQALSHGTLEPGRYVRLIFADSGSGMDENILAHIFEPFFTTKVIGKGTGLGLSLVHAIITDSGGAIDVQSAPQQGSTFTIYLPQSQVTLAAPEAAAAAPLRGRGERELLIDDENAAWRAGI